MRNSLGDAKVGENSLIDEYWQYPKPDVAIVGEINADLILYGLPREIPEETEILAQWFYPHAWQFLRHSGPQSASSKHSGNVQRKSRERRAGGDVPQSPLDDQERNSGSAQILGTFIRVEQGDRE